MNPPEYLFIMNPMAGKGAGARADAALEGMLKRSGLGYRVAYTEGPGHATQLARASKSRFVVAVGGDGTINEVVNGVAGTDHVMGVIPAGSGNDLIRSLGIPHAMERALQVLKAGRVEKIDVGKVQTGRLTGGSIEYAPWRLFVNGLGIGFDGAVARRVSEITYLRGTLLYLAAVLQIVWKYRVPEMSLCVDDRKWTGREFLMAVGNGRSAGGGFYLTPEAEVADGWLDLMIIRSVAIRRILGIIPGVMGGKPVRRDFVRYLKLKTLEARSSDTFNVHADGEIVGRDVHGVRVAVEPGVLNVVTGR